MQDIVWTTDGILSALYAAVAVFLLVVLYHVLFIVVDVRKIVRRTERITRELQAVILKPLAVTDEILSWVLQFVNSQQKKAPKKPEFKKRSV